MPAWDTVQLAPPVTSRDYNQGFQNFLQLGDRLGQLPQSYYAGQQMGRNTALQNAFSNGLPTDSQGNVDVNATLQTIGKLGGAQYVQQLLPFMMKQQMLQSLDQQPTGGPGGQGQTGTGRAHLGAPPNGTTDEGDYTSPAGYSAGGAPSNNASGSPAPTDGGESGGAKTVVSMAAAYGLPPPMVAAVAKSVGVQPNAPIGDEDTLNKAQTRIRQLANARLAQAQPPETGGIASPSEGGYVTPSQPSSIAGQLTPGRDPLTEAKSLRLRAEGLRRDAQRLEIIQPNMGKAKLEQAKSLDEQASRYEDSIKTGAEAQFKGDLERYGKEATTYNAQGMVADDLIPKVREAKALMNRPDIASGAPFPELVNRFKAVAANLGITNPNAAMPPELFKKFVSDILTQQIRGLAQSGVGRVLMSEVQNLRDGVATLQNTPASNRAQLEILRRTLEKQQVLADMAHNYKGGHLDVGFDTMASNYLRSHPTFSQDEIAHPEILGAPTMRAGIDKPGDKATGRKGDEQTVWGLKPGDPYRTPSGSLKWVE